LCLGATPSVAQKPTENRSPAAAPGGQTVPDFPEIVLPPIGEGWHVRNAYSGAPPGHDDAEPIDIVEFNQGDGSTGESLQLIRAPFDSLPVEATAAAVIEQAKNNERSTCVDVTFRDFEYTNPAGDVELGFESQCHGFRSPTNNQVFEDQFIVTVRRVTRTGTAILTRQRGWTGTVASWPDYLRNHVDYATNWNRELDNVVVCDLTTEHFNCPPLSDSSLELTPQTRSAMEQVNSRGVAGALTIRPAEATDLVGEPGVYLVPMEREPWNDTQVLGQILQVIMVGVREGKSADLVLVYSDDPPNTAGGRAQQRRHAANTLHWFDMQIRHMQRLMSVIGVGAPDFEIRINVEEDA